MLTSKQHRKLTTQQEVTLLMQRAHFDNLANKAIHDNRLQQGENLLQRVDEIDKKLGRR